MSLRRVCLMLIAVLACLGFPVFAQAGSLAGPDPLIRIGVLGLFHSEKLTVRPHDGGVVALRCGDRVLRIEGGQSVELALQGESIECRSESIAVPASRAEITNPSADFVLGVPGEIERHYRGALQVHPSDDELSATVTMSRETAVGSIVAAESSRTAPLDALKAQAVVARSYLAAGPRHEDLDFCDTTHCQYLVAVPSADDAAAEAASATRGMVVSHEGRVVRALYSARCGGQTRTLADIGLEGRGYPYYRVGCPSCVRDPDAWTRRLDGPEAADLIQKPGDETARLRLVRERGWQALPSNNYRIAATATGATLEGAGSGHGVGLCQHGAAAMASEGHDLLSILRHYFPNTTLAPVRSAVTGGHRRNSVILTVMIRFLVPLFFLPRLPLGRLRRRLFLRTAEANFYGLRIRSPHSGMRRRSALM